MRTRKTWREKLERFAEPRIVDMPANWRSRHGPGKLLIARPMDVDAMIRRVARGQVTTMRDLREALAFGLDVVATCPTTTGIFVRIAAEAAEESRLAGQVDVTPYWRVLSSEGRLNPRFPGGVEQQAERLQAEGHTIEAGAGNLPPRVRGYASAAASLLPAEADAGDLG